VTAIHSQITQYIHVLDPFDAIDFSGGQVCKFGIAEAAAANPVDGRDSGAKDFCAKVIGYSGALFVGHFIGSFSDSNPGTEAGNAYAQCLYFTNFMPSIALLLNIDSVLAADGTSDGSCTSAPIVPADDPAGLCPACTAARCFKKYPKPNLTVKTPETHACLNAKNDFQSESVTLDLVSTWFKTCMSLNDKSFALFGQNEEELVANGWDMVNELESDRPVLSPTCVLGWDVPTVARRGDVSPTFGPENSIGAAVGAINQGYAVYLDVSLTKDDTLIVFSDDNLLRLTGLDADVRDLTFAELADVRYLSTSNGITYDPNADYRVSSLTNFLLDVCTALSSAKLYYKVKPLYTEANFIKLLNTIETSPCTGVTSVFEMSGLQEAKMMKLKLSKMPSLSGHKVSISFHPETTPGGVEMWLRSRLGTRIVGNDVLSLHYSIMQAYPATVQEYRDDGYCVLVYGGNAASLTEFVANADAGILDMPSQVSWTDPSLGSPISLAVVSYQLRTFAVNVKFETFQFMGDAKLSFGITPLDSVGTLRVVMYIPTQPEPILDTVIALGSKVCTLSIFGMEFCLASLGTAGASSGENPAGDARRLASLGDLFLTIGMSNMDGRSMAARIGSFNDQVMEQKPEVVASRDTMKELLDMDTRVVGDDLPFKSSSFFNKPKFAPHACMRGENALPVALDEVVKTANSVCVVLGEGSSLHVSLISGTGNTTSSVTTNVNDLRRLQTMDCYRGVKQFVLNAFPNGIPSSVDESLVDQILDDIFVNCSKHTDGATCQGVTNAKGSNLCSWTFPSGASSGKCTTLMKNHLVLEGLLTTNVASFLDQIESCAEQVPSMTTFVCEAMNDSTLWPSTSPPGVAQDELVRQAVHYTLVLDKIIGATKSNGNDFLIDWVLGSLGPLLEDPDVTIHNYLTDYEMARLRTEHLSVGSWSSLNTNECCENPKTSFGFKTQILETVIEHMHKGSRDNGAAGQVAALATTLRMDSTSAHKDLYTSFFAAIASHAAESAFEYAPIAAPNVICSEPKTYVYHRMIASYVHSWAKALSTRRTHLGGALNPWTVIPVAMSGKMDWRNSKLTQRWGAVNKVSADAWLKNTALPLLDLPPTHNVVRIDFLYTTPQHRVVHNLVVASLVDTVDGLRLFASPDAGPEWSFDLDDEKTTDDEHTTEFSNLLIEGEPCLPLLGSAKLCFELGAGSRRLNDHEDGDSEGGNALTRVLSTFIKRSGSESAALKIMEQFAIHPCLGRAFGIENDDHLFMTKDKCTVLGPDSFVFFKNTCGASDTSWDARPRQLGHPPGTPNSCEINFRTVVRSIGTRRLATTVGELDLDVNIVVTVASDQLRLQILTWAGLILYDVTLRRNESQCTGDPSLFEFCLGRVFQDSESDLIGASVTIANVRQEVTVASFDIVHNRLITDGFSFDWVSDSIFKLVQNPEPFDPCANVVCPENEVCNAGQPGQEWCFPDLSAPYEGGPQLLTQLFHLSFTPYYDFNLHSLIPEGWTLNRHHCLKHSPKMNIYGWSDRQDCMLVFTRLQEGDTTPICVAAFEGVDDFSEAAEGALSWRKVHAGYWVWGGMVHEYERFTRQPFWEPMLAMMYDPNQCKQVYSIGHSFGSILATMFRLDHQLGRGVVFALPSFFPYGWRPGVAIGDAFIQQGDAIMFIPPGWTLGAHRIHMLCLDGSIEYRGVNPPRQFNNKNFCEISSRHTQHGYEVWMATHFGEGVTVESILSGECPKENWIVKCVNDMCYGEHGDILANRAVCAMGPMAYRADLQIEAARDEMYARLGELPGRFKNFVNREGGCPLPQTRGDEITDEGQGGGCINMIGRAFVLIKTVRQLDPSIVRTTASLSPYSKDDVGFQIVLRDGPPEDIEFRVSYTNIPFPVTLVLKSNSYFCPNALNFPPARACVSYKEFLVYLVIFIQDEVAFSIPLAEVQVNPTPKVTPVILNAMLTSSANFALFMSPSEYFKDYDEMGEFRITNMGSCQKITSPCLAGGTCEPFRGAQCISILENRGVCVCGPGMCANEEGKCEEGALTESANPCVSPDESFVPFIFLPDPSQGAPFERCVLLSEKSYIRLDYPTPEEILTSLTNQSPIPFRTLVKFELTVVPMSVERMLRVEILMSPLFDSFTVTLIDEAVGPVASPRTFSLGSNSEEQSVCASYLIGELDMSLADVCVVAGPAMPREERRRRRRLSNESTSRREGRREQERRIREQERRFSRSRFNRRHLAEGDENIVEEDPIVYERNLETTIVLPSEEGQKLRRVEMATVATDGQVTSNVPTSQKAIEETYVNSLKAEISDPVFVTLIVFAIWYGIIIFVSCALNFRGGPENDVWKMTLRFTRKSRLGSNIPGGKDGKASEPMSPIGFARTFQRTTKKTGVRIMQCSRKLVISNKYLNNIFCYSAPAHFVRAFAVVGNLNSIVLFPDEISKMAKINSVVMRRFLCYRRSAMVILCGIFAKLIFFALVVQIPKELNMGKSLLKDKQKLQRTVKLMSTFGGGQSAFRRRLGMEDFDENDEFGAHFTPWNENDKHFANDWSEGKYNGLAAISATTPEDELAFKNHIMREVAAIAEHGVSSFTAYDDYEGIRRLLEDTGAGKDYDHSGTRRSGTRRRVQETAAGETAASTNLPPTEEDEPELARAIRVIKKLDNFTSMMRWMKITLWSVCVIITYLGLRAWDTYDRSYTWTFFGLVIRVFTFTVFSWVPWYNVYFHDSNDLPNYLIKVAKTYSAFIINVPLLSISLMITPAIINGSVLAMDLLPFTIIPYMIISVCPILGIICLWPLFSFFGHSGANWFLLYGSLIYVGFACIVAVTAIRSLRSFEGLKTLGFSAKTMNAKREADAHMAAMSENQNDGAGSAHNSQAGNSSAKEKQDNIDNIFATLQQEEEDQIKKNALVSRTSISDNIVVAAYKDDESIALNRSEVLNYRGLATQSVAKLEDQDRTQKSGLSIFIDPRAVVSSNNNESGKRGAVSSRRSVAEAEILVQGALILELKEKRLPSMIFGRRFAKVIYKIGCIMMLVGLVKDSGSLFELITSDDQEWWGFVVTFILECMANEMHMKLAFVDVIITGLITLRLFNGYMQDDETLSLLMTLSRYSEKVTKSFSSGITQARNLLEPSEAPKRRWWNFRKSKKAGEESSSMDEDEYEEGGKVMDKKVLVPKDGLKKDEHDDDEEEWNDQNEQEEVKKSGKEQTRV